MTITNLIPSLKGTGSRRAVDKVAELRDENVKLLTRQASADGFFAQLMHDVVTTNTAWEQEKQRRQEAETVAACVQGQLDDKDREHAATIARIDDRHNAIVTQLQNELADAERRLNIRNWAEAAAAKTQELDVRSLRERFETGPVRRLGASPMAAVTNPGHI